MKNNYEIICEYKKRLKNLQKEGKLGNRKEDEAFFWSGKMADLVGQMINIPLKNSVHIVPLLELVLNNYNECIYSMAINKN